MLTAITGMSRFHKALVLLVLDALLIVLSFLLAIGLRTGMLWPLGWMSAALPVLVVLPLSGVALSLWLGIPTIVLSAFENRAVLKIGLFAVLLSAIGVAANQVSGTAVPRSVPLIFGPLFLFLAVLARFTLIFILDRLARRTGNRRNVAIYGAGSAGQSLLAALRNSDDRCPVALFDDNPSLRRVQIGGLRVRTTENLGHAIATLGIGEIILALPNIDSVRRREILNRLANHGCAVLELPNFGRMLDGRVLSDQLLPVSPDDLLGRTPVDLRLPDIRDAYVGRSIMVTGAGGSIGAELCRQLLETGPARLVLFEQCEYALYAVDMELRRHPNARAVDIHPVLGSVCDSKRVAGTLSEHGVEIILHSAAYKHVPLVESNVLEGVQNNVFGTLCVAEAARANNVGRFILVSTDKAVRPTNVMGATKRLAEMFIQAMHGGAGGTVFSMVRFGNVLGSSGSVVPLFQRQIREGGPLTLTDLRVTRYFMTTCEAAQLVLLAGSFAHGGEVFVLDMGQPVRIAELARNLVELSGLSVRDQANPDGDIEIAVTGLRSGEKLYEELLVGDNVVSTPHDKILRAIEYVPSEWELAGARQQLTEALRIADASLVRDLLGRFIEGYSPARPDIAV